MFINPRRKCHFQAGSTLPSLFMNEIWQIWECFFSFTWKYLGESAMCWLVDSVCWAETFLFAGISSEVSALLWAEVEGCLWDAELEVIFHRELQRRFGLPETFFEPCGFDTSSYFIYVYIPVTSYFSAFGNTSI